MIGNMDFANDNWTGYNHHHLVHVTMMLVEVVLITFLLLSVIFAAVMLDRGLVDQNSLDENSYVLVHDEDNTERGKEKIFSIKNDIYNPCSDTDNFGNRLEDKCFSNIKYPEFECKKKTSLKLEPVRAELPDPVCRSTDNACMSFLKHPEEDKSETNPKWACGSKCHLGSLQKASWKSSETLLPIKDKEFQVFFQLDMTHTTNKEACGEEMDFKFFDCSNGFKRALNLKESLLPKSISCPSKHDDVDSSQVTLREKEFLETHEDGLHMHSWNNLNFDSLNSGKDDDDDDNDIGEFFQKQLRESGHSSFSENITYSENALEKQRNHTLYGWKMFQLMENKNIYISPAENEEDCIDIVELKDLSNDSMIEQKIENTDLQQCQELKICENTLACGDKYKFIMQSEGVESNLIEKSFSDKCIQVGLTEKICCVQVEVGTYHASHENKTVSNPQNDIIKVENRMDPAVDSFHWNEEIDISSENPLKGNMLHEADGPDKNSQNDNKKFIIEEKVENPSNIRNQVILGTNHIYTGSRMMDFTSEQLMSFKNNRTQGPENKKWKVWEETSEEKSKYGFDADRNSVVNLESIGNKECFGDNLVHDKDKKGLIHPLNSEEHNFELDSHRKEKYGSQCSRGRKRSRQMEHGGRKRKQYRPPSRGRVVGRGCAEKIELGQSYGQFLDLKSRAVHICEKDVLEAMTDAVPVDCSRYQGSEEGTKSDCQRMRTDKYSPLNNKKHQRPKVPLIPFQDNLMGKTLLTGSRLVHKENQDQNLKMKKVINTDQCNVTSVKDLGRCAHEEVARTVRTFFACKMTTSLNDADKRNDSSNRKFHKEVKSKWNKLNVYQDPDSHYISELLQELVSTWYFFPMLGRNMELCLPSSLQAFFERLINGPLINLEERMSYEWLRLQSFSTFPSSARRTSVRMAQSGFYYTGQGTCTRCYACNVEHEGWNNTDDPHEVHQRMSPNCPFLGGNPTYPNFPIIPDTVHNGNNTLRCGSIATPSMHERTQSRVPEPYPQPIITSAINPSSTPHLDEMSVSPSAFTNACQQNPSETMQVEARWENPETHGYSVSRKQQQTDSSPSTGTSQTESFPTSTSLMHPQQPRIDAENTEYMSPGNFVLTLPARQEEDPGVDPTPQTMSERPKHPEHAPLSSRINSYTGWPIHLDQTPQQMAEAGFFYAGIMDYTRCFQCGGGLKNWESRDNPWIEHARWYPQCAYVLCKRGQKFVNAVLKKQAELLAAQNTEQSNSGSTTTTNITRSGTDTSSESQSAQPQSGQPRYLQNPHENDIANRLIEEMGYQRERVREAILEVKRIRGQQEITIEHVLELLLADEERRARAGRQNEAATLEELIQESGQLTFHEDNNSPPSPPPPVAKTTATLTPITIESYQGGGHPHQVVGGRSSGQHQRVQTNQTTGLGQGSSIPQTRQNISGTKSIAVDVPSSSLSFGNQEGHQSIKSTAGNRPLSPPLLETTSLPALDAESLREEYLRLRDQNICKVCMERNVELAFLPCGHLVCCEVCGQTLRFCPICGAKIHASVKTYIS